MMEDDAALHAPFPHARTGEAERGRRNRRWPSVVSTEYARETKGAVQKHAIQKHVIQKKGEMYVVSE